MKHFLIIVLVSLYSFSALAAMPVSAPIREFAGRQGALASKTVVRIICRSTNMGGTGFFHKSGWIITANHVVAGCKVPDLLIVTSAGQVLKAVSVDTDPQVDLAAILPSVRVTMDALPVSKRTEIEVGTPVVTWGFPAGYSGALPLLTTGHLAGVDRVPVKHGQPVPRWIVNAAFNGGNSGGPVLSPETGEVVGVVASKLAPIPPEIESALSALAHQKSGFLYKRILPNGQVQNMTEGQVIGEVLLYLRSQTQLVLGQAVTSAELLDFLHKEGLE